MPCRQPTWDFLRDFSEIWIIDLATDPRQRNANAGSRLREIKATPIRARKLFYMKNTVQFTLNGSPVSLDTDDERMLLWVLRSDLALPGTKYGCGVGICGACTVVINGEPRRSCLTPLQQVAGSEILTVEGLGKDGELHPLQQAFIGHGAFQCGYCTSGMLMEAYALLLDDARPSRDKIVSHMERNLCRCGAHQRIVDAIEQASEQAGSGR
jgi:aerobic-type carbon monoxide dehydrogenase small subunit (CoxS/CutS family)